jgi:hypothetical protein
MIPKKIVYVIEGEENKGDFLMVLVRIDDETYLTNWYFKPQGRYPRSHQLGLDGEIGGINGIDLDSHKRVESLISEFSENPQYGKLGKKERGEKLLRYIYDNLQHPGT